MRNTKRSRSLAVVVCGVYYLRLSCTVKIKLNRVKLLPPSATHLEFPAANKLVLPHSGRGLVLRARISPSFGLRRVAECEVSNVPSLGSACGSYAMVIYRLRQSAGCMSKLADRRRRLEANPDSQLVFHLSNPTTSLQAPTSCHLSQVLNCPIVAHCLTLFVKSGNICNTLCSWAVHTAMNASRRKSRGTKVSRHRRTAQSFTARAAERDRFYVNIPIGATYSSATVNRPMRCFSRHRSTKAFYFICIHPGNIC